MSAPGVELEVEGGRQAQARAAELVALHDDVVGAGDGGFERRFLVWCRQPGFVLAEARHGGYVVGCACGLPLRPSTDWWREVTAPLPAAVTDEHPGRTFALTLLLVRGSWRRQGIATELLELVLDGRAEERATVKLPAGTGAAQAVFRAWGWAKVARTRGADPSGPVSDILTRPL